MMASQLFDEWKLPLWPVSIDWRPQWLSHSQGISEFVWNIVYSLLYALFLRWLRLDKLWAWGCLLWLSSSDSESSGKFDSLLKRDDQFSVGSSGPAVVVNASLIWGTRHLLTALFTSLPTVYLTRKFLDICIGNSLVWTGKHIWDSGILGAPWHRKILPRACSQSWPCQF